MEERFLILSPQAGFGNRIRMLCSGLTLAKVLGRTPLHYWPGGKPTEAGDVYFVGAMREQGWDGFFLPHPEFLLADPNKISEIDLSFSEWLEGEFWYPKQSTAHKLWDKVPEYRLLEDANILEHCKQRVIMIESSREMRLSRYSQEEWHQLMTQTYQEYFKPQPRYLKRLANDPSFDIGISIRRGEFLSYFPEENHSKETLIRFLFKTFSKEEGKSIVLFSDDHELRDDLRSRLQTINIDCPHLEWEGLEPWEKGYLEFLTLGTRVSECIYGTPHSSFGEQAAVFGGVPFLPIKPDKECSKSVKMFRPMCKMEDEVTIAILVKDKAHVLPLYLELIQQQTYPASKIRLFIRTNNNLDNTVEILEEWINKVGDKYLEIYFDPTDVEEPVQNYTPHEWNAMRFDVLGRIRKESVEWAREKGTHYFVVDCDNFIVPETLEMLLHTGLPVIGPLLKLGDDPLSMYSNFHHMTTNDGYFQASSVYYELLYQTTKGLIEVDVIHCTYLIRHEVLHKVRYLDGTGRHEYVIFSESLRIEGIPQYLDNRYIYGKLTFCDTAEEFEKKNFSNLYVH